MTRRSFISLFVGLVSICPIVRAEAVNVWEDTLSIPTYAWEEDIHPVFQEYEAVTYYPWTRQDFLTKEKKDRVWKAIHLENEYLRVTCLPELGGRLYSVFDKTTQEEMFHKNEVIKPALIAMRGAWINGGVEWNAGPQGHTVFIMEPVSVATETSEDGAAGLIIGATEKTFGTRWEVRISLLPGRSLLQESIRILNPTDGVQPYYFWNNTSFPNRKGTRFIYPMTLGTDHNGTSFFTWPEFEGRDITWLKNYDTMTSIFGYEVPFDFFGAYDVDKDRGIVSYANHHQTPGKKAWTWGNDDFGLYSQMSLTDSGREEAPYIEVQSGPLRTQADFGMLQPHQAVAWQEFWYPVHGLGDGFEYATQDVAVQVHRKDTSLEVDLLSTGIFEDARCTLSQEGKENQEEAAALAPDKATRISFRLDNDAPATIRVWSVEAGTLLEYTTPLDIPKKDIPDLTKKPAREDGVPTPGELFAQAALLDSQSQPEAARKGYEKILEADPRHVPALTALAVLDNEEGRYAEAEAHAVQATAQDPYAGEAAYQRGVAALRQGDLESAAAWGWNASRAVGYESAGLNLAGRAAMRLGKYQEASRIFAQAMAIAPLDTLNRDSRLLSRYPWDDTETLLADIARYRKADPDNALLAVLEPLEKRYALFSEKDDAGTAELAAIAQNLVTIGGDPAVNALETASVLADHGLPHAALPLLYAAVQDTRIFPEEDPFVFYALAYYRDWLGDDWAGDLKNTQAAEWLDRAAAARPTRAFPHGMQALKVLEWAAGERPDDANAHYLLGLVYAGMHRVKEAIPEWEKATERNTQYGLAWRLVGLHYWKIEKDLLKAEEALRNALRACIGDQIILRDLTALLTETGRRPEAILLAESLPADTFKRYDLALWQAQAYLDEKRYDDCIMLLENARFSNWEGVSTPRDIYVGALLARGKGFFDNGAPEKALDDFTKALTYPENLGVGCRYKRTDAEICWWAGKALAALGRPEDARTQWRDGAGQITTADPPATFITIPKAQDEYVYRCRAALETTTQQ